MINNNILTLHWDLKISVFRYGHSKTIHFKEKHHSIFQKIYSILSNNTNVYNLSMQKYIHFTLFLFSLPLGLSSLYKGARLNLSDWDLGSQSCGKVDYPSVFYIIFLFTHFKFIFDMKNKQQNQSNLPLKVLYYLKVAVFFLLFIWGCNHKW